MARFELYNYPKWKPVKIFQITFERVKVSESPRERLRGLTVFAGHQPVAIKKILSAISEQDLEAQRWKPKLNDVQKKTLVKAFGSDWKEILGLTKLAEFSATSGRIRAQTVRVQEGGQATEEEQEEAEELEEEPEREEEPEQEEIAIEEPVAVTEPETEEELLKLIEEAEKEEEAKKIVSPEEIPVKIEVLEARGAFVSFVFDYINSDDNIDTIKKKIYAYTKVPMVAQHLFYIRESPIFKGILESVNLEYTIYNLKDAMKQYPASILNLFSALEGRSREILGIPIDEMFIQGMDVEKTLFIKDNNNKLLLEYSERMRANNEGATRLSDSEGGFSRLSGGDSRERSERTRANNEGATPDELYFVDFVDVISNLVSNVKLNDVIISNPNALRDFYGGFVVKYWPGIRNTSNSLIALINKKYQPVIGPGTIIRDQDIIQNQILAIESINKQEVKFSVHQVRILSATIRIGFPEEIGITPLLKRDKLFSYRNLFDFYEVNEITPYIKYKDREANKINHKVFKPFYNNNITLVKRAWSLTEPVGLSIKMRMSTDLSKTAYSSFATVNIFEDGRIEIKATWNEVENATVRNIMEIIDVLHQVVNRINDLGPNVFEKTRRRIVIEDPQISSINVNREFDVAMSEEDYRDLALITKIFSGYCVLDLERNIDLEKNAFSIYWRYLRTSAISRKGPKIRMRGRNEVLMRDTDTSEKIVHGLVIEMIGGEISKITINGARSIDEVNRIYNFYIRLIYVLKNTDKVLKTASFEFARNLYKTYMQQAKKTKAGLRIVKGRPIKRVRKLQQIDPKLFNFRVRDEKFQFYSRVCQSRQQPTPLTDAELKEYKKTKSPEEVLRYSNKSRKGQVVNYVCEDDVYRFPGFIPKDKHPDGFCMPCCFKKSSHQNPRSTNYKIFQQCIREDLGQTISPEEDPSKEATNRRYILGWKSEEIEEGRFSALPVDLDEFFNVSRPGSCNIKNNMLQKSSECYLIPGMYQDNQSFPRVVANALIGHATAEERAKIQRFWDDTIDFLRKHPSIFNTLEKGEVRRRFGTIERYLNYLTGEETIDDAWTRDLLSNYNALGDPINIVIFEERIPDKDITIICSEETFSFLENLMRPDRGTIIVIKSRQSEQRVFYYGVYLVQTDASAIPKITIQKMFSRDDMATRKITTLFKDLCGITDTLGDKLSDFLNKFGAQYMLDAKTLQEFLANTNYSIVGQVLILDRPQYVIIKHGKNKFSFPVNNNSVQLIQVPVMAEPVEGDPQIILEFLKKLTIGDIKVERRVLDPKEQNVIGFFLNTRYFVPLQKTSIKKLQSPKETYVLRVDPREINRYILSGEKIPDKRSREANKINFEHEVLRTLTLEISRKLYNEKNKRMRNQILDIIDKLPLRNGNDFQLIKNRLLELKISGSDFEKLKDIVTQMFKNKHQLNLPKKELEIKNKALLNQVSFDFDRTSQREIEHIIATQPTVNALKEIQKIIEDIAKGIIIIVPEADVKIKRNNIIDTCTDKKRDKCRKPQCLWSSSGCRVAVPKPLYKEYIRQITEEIVKNELQRFDILGNNIDVIMDKTKFLRRPTEVIFETTPRIMLS